MKTKYSIGDVIIEDRNIYIGTDKELPTDREHPVVKLKIMDIQAGIYEMYNMTRDCMTVGLVVSIDEAPHIMRSLNETKLLN